MIAQKKKHLCPPWVGYLMTSPLRRFYHNPQAILSPYLRRGMCTLDIGSAMGFFSLPMARSVGSAGQVICLDVQAVMLDRLRKRAANAGLLDRIEARLCKSDTLGIDDLSGEIDFALAFAVAHELPDIPNSFEEIAAALKNEGQLLLAEPVNHVSRADFRQTIEAAVNAGLQPAGTPEINRSFAVLLRKT